MCVLEKKSASLAPRKSTKGGKRVRRMVNQQNVHLEEKYNDPPLHLREAIPDTNLGNVSDEEDPIDTNLRCLDVEFNHGLESPLTWLVRDCHSQNIPVIDRIPFTPPYSPGVNIQNLKNMSCAEVMAAYHPNSLYQRFADESNGYFYRWHHGQTDIDDVEESSIYKVLLYDLAWKDRTMGSIV